MSSITITLGETKYEVPKMNIGQLEEVTEAFELPPIKRPFAILKIAMRRAEPKVDNFADLEAGNDEISVAIPAILKNSGFAQAASPNVAAPEAPGTEQAAS